MKINSFKALILICAFLTPIARAELVPAMEVYGDVQWFYNPQDCPASVLEDAKIAAFTWSIYGEYNATYGGTTALGVNSLDNVRTVSCLPFNDYVALYGNSSGVTDYQPNASNNGLLDADIVINAGVYAQGSCILLHEFGHTIGLGQSSLTWSIMNPYISCTDGRLDWRDLHNIADLYDTPPNCTVYVHESLEVFFPYLDGNAVELSPAGFVDGLMAFELKDVSFSYRDWECELEYAPNYDWLEFEAIYQGNLYDVRLDKQGSVWLLTIL